MRTTQLYGTVASLTKLLLLLISVLKRYQFSYICPQVNPKKRVIFGRTQVEKLNPMGKKADFRKTGGRICFDNFLCKQIINYCGIITDMVISDGLT